MCPARVCHTQDFIFLLSKILSFASPPSSMITLNSDVLAKVSCDYVYEIYSLRREEKIWKTTYSESCYNSAELEIDTEMYDEKVLVYMYIIPMVKLFGMAVNGRISISLSQMIVKCRCIMCSVFFFLFFFKLLWFRNDGIEHFFSIRGTV